ncbi:MAG: DUF1444 family protein [Capsulimonadaceae bacterium]
MALFKFSMAEFTKAVAQATAARGALTQVDMERHSITRSDGVVFNLGNAYDEYCAVPVWKRRSVIRLYARQFAEFPGSVEYTPAEAKGMLMPKVRERSYLEQMKLQFRLDGMTDAADVPYRVFGGGHLTLEVVLDEPRMIRNINQAKLDEWCLNLHDALDIADTNILRRSEVGSGFAEVAPGLYRSQWEDCYDASRLLNASLFAHLPIKGRPVAMVPNRDVLLITSANDPDGLVHMANLSREILGKPRPMTGVAFRLDAGWVPFLPPAEHPAYRSLRLLAVQTTALAANQQREVLDALQLASGDPCFVAGYHAHELADGQIVTTSVWSEGIDSLLPETDRIAFMRPGPRDAPGRVVGYGNWEAVLDVMGNTVEPVAELYPSRFRVRTFPTEAQLRAIGVSGTEACPAIGSVEGGAQLRLRSPHAPHRVGRPHWTPDKDAPC